MEEYIIVSGESYVKKTEYDELLKEVEILKMEIQSMYDEQIYGEGE